MEASTDMGSFLSNEIRRLGRRWQAPDAWPRRLEYLQVNGLRGWTGQRIEFSFPIVAIVGENGSGKSTLLQAAASVYRSTDTPRFGSDFFPKTAWDDVQGVEVKFGYLQGRDHGEGSVRKPTTKWLGNVDRPEREVRYVDLSRIQPLGARVGYTRIAKTTHHELKADLFDVNQVQRMSSIMGREYTAARMATSDIDENRLIPVITRRDATYSGFHQGSGEITVAKLLQIDLPRYGLVLIDEIESSLHPRSQRRLIRDLADKCREREAQIILTTHSPYVLEELPPSARYYIMESGGKKSLVKGVSPEFAMTQMDDEDHPECELYVEDFAAQIWLEEMLAAHGQNVFPRCNVTPYGAASVGYALGQMVHQKRFRRPTCVFLDGDTDPADGCVVLPGGEAPEPVVFEGLRAIRWGDLWTRIGRDIASVSDACSQAMLLRDHHDWVRSAANQLRFGGDVLWRAMCAEWSKGHAKDVAPIVQAIEMALDR
jgi:predicted ATPase